MPTYDSNKAHYLAVTGIVVKDGKYLIVKRAAHEKAFPNMWTVPGGKMERADYEGRAKDTSSHWYNVFQDVLKREVKEEVGLEISDIQFLVDMVFIRPDEIPAVIISLFAKYAGGEVKLCDALTDYAWVDLEEAKKYELIEGIYEELVMLEKRLRGGVVGEWGKA